MNTLDDIRMMVIMHLFDKYEITIDQHTHQRDALSRTLMKQYTLLREHYYDYAKNWLKSFDSPRQVILNNWVKVTARQGQSKLLYLDGHTIGKISISSEQLLQGDNILSFDISEYCLCFSLLSDRCIMGNDKSTLYYYDEKFPDDLYSALKDVLKGKNVKLV